MLKTIEGKEIKINEAYIEVLKTNIDEFYVRIKMFGKLPRCRKYEDLLYSYTSNRDILKISDFFGKKSYFVHVDDMYKLLKTLPIRTKISESKITEVETAVNKTINIICNNYRN